MPPFACMRGGKEAVTLLFCLAALCSGAAAGDAVDPFPGFTASSYLLAVDGHTVWARSVDRRLPPASLTKVMTAMLAIRNSRMDDIVTIGDAASRETGTRLGLRQGERMYAGFLLAAALLGSANDACHALADRVSGSEAAFTDLMNREAASLGMTATHFTNACGHDAPGHYSTAHDLALLAEAALRDPVFAQLVSTVDINISTKGGGRVFHLENKNERIGRYPGAAGVKSGFTPGAGKCVIALVKRNGRRVLFVVLNAPNRWWGAVDILDAAFERPSDAPGQAAP